MKWLYLDPSRTKKSLFGFKPVAVKIAKYVGNGSAKSLTIKGWKTFTTLLDYDPITRKRYKRFEWFLIAARKGR
jgi:hypothetical protein